MAFETCRPINQWQTIFHIITWFSQLTLPGIGAVSKPEVMRIVFVHESVYMMHLEIINKRNH